MLHLKISTILDRELILANVQYDHVLEMLQAIHPTYKGHFLNKKHF